MGRVMDASDAGAYALARSLELSALVASLRAAVDARKVRAVGPVTAHDGTAFGTSWHIRSCHGVPLCHLPQVPVTTTLVRLSLTPRTDLGATIGTAGVEALCGLGCTSAGPKADEDVCDLGPVAGLRAVSTNMSRHQRRNRR